jgi:hypothetical protein
MDFPALVAGTEPLIGAGAVRGTPAARFRGGGATVVPDGRAVFVTSRIEK